MNGYSVGYSRTTNEKARVNMIVCAHCGMSKEWHRRSYSGAVCELRTAQSQLIWPLYALAARLLNAVGF